MALPLSAFPFATPYDPAEDPPTSVDPLGTVAEAERLADMLLPGMTARMWRVRLLTFTAVTAIVAERAVEITGRDDIRDEARLAFERLFVSSLVRRASDDGMVAATRRVPGTDRARRALRVGEPLTRANFLKGQAVNGPSGVMARLARQLGIVDDEYRLGPRGVDLVLSWSSDETLPGALEGRRDAGEGGRWVTSMAVAARAAVNGTWPGNQANIWSDLAARFRPDEVEKAERKTLEHLLWFDPLGLRGRALDLLRDSEETYKATREGGRAATERAVLRDGVVPKLGDDAVDTAMKHVLDGVEAFESTSGFLQSAFDTLRWSLSSRGAAHLRDVLADGRVQKNLDRLRRRLPAASSALGVAMSELGSEPMVGRDVLQPLRQLQEDAQRGSESVAMLVDAVLDRHDRVQKEKRKGRWIERGDALTLMPGFGFDDEQPPFYVGLYLHPFRVVNAFSLLGDLGIVRRIADVEG